MNKLEQIKTYINILNLPNPSILFENPDYTSAIIGIDYNTGSVVYDYNKMVKYLMETEKLNEIDAIEFINYNTIRAIPYFSGGAKPIICYPIDD